MNDRHNHFLEHAFEEAKKALACKEVPVGAVIVHNDMIIARAHNQKETLNDPTQHAELIAIQRAATHLGDWRLSQATLYSTLEPCPMCLGAILHARIPLLIFGAKDTKWGACGSVVDLVGPTYFNHTTEVLYRPDPRFSHLLTDFFKQLRR